MEELDNSIKRLREYIIHYDSVLNESGTWLFLATIACWSVPEGLPRKVALGAVIVIFGQQIFSQIRSKTPFKKRIKYLIEEIEMNVECATEKDALKFRLVDVRDKYLRNWRLVATVPAYVASSFFIIFSIVYWLGYF
jgi:hypothetical protein